MGKDRLKKYLAIAWIVLSVILLSITYFFVLYRNQSIGETIGKIIAILRPLILGAVFAYIMKSTCNFYERILTKVLLKSGKRNEKQIAKPVCGIAVIFTYITWAAVITGLLLIAVPQIINSITDFANLLIIKIPEFIDLIVEWEQKFLEDQEMLRPYFDKLVAGLIEWSETDLIPWIQSTVTGLIPKLLGIVTSLVDIVIGLVISVFILLGRKVLARKSMMLLHCIFKKEKTVNVIAEEFHYADKMFSGFLEGKVIDSTIIGLIYYIVLEIMNVPYPALVAVICGVTNIIPIFGPFIGAIPSGFIILTADPIKVIPFVIFVFVIQFLDGYIIDPHIVGGNIKMSSFCVVFAVILFGGLWGFTGLLIGVPTFAVIYDIFRKLALFILKKRDKQDIIDSYRRDFKKDEKPTTKKRGKPALASENGETVTVAVSDEAPVSTQEEAESDTTQDASDTAQDASDTAQQ